MPSRPAILPFLLLAALLAIPAATARQPVGVPLSREVLRLDDLGMVIALPEDARAESVTGSESIAARITPVAAIDDAREQGRVRGVDPVEHKEPLEFEYVKPSQRSYK